MRVLHICQRDDPDEGGALRVAEALVRAQRAAGLDARMVFLYGTPGRITRALGASATALGIASSKEARKAVPLLRKTIRGIAPEIIHSHDGILWPRLALFRIGIPVVTHGHLPPEFNGGLKRLLGWPWVKSTTARVIGISEQTAEQWIAAGIPKSRVEIIPNGVDFERFAPLDPGEKNELRERLGLPLDKKILLWVGRLHQGMKGTDRAERVANALDRDAVVVMVGHGPERAAIEERQKDLIESGGLILAGGVEFPEHYYQAADAYLFSSYWEPFGLVILEAVAAELPIVAFPVTRGGGAVRLLEEFGSISLEEDASAEAVQTAVAGLWAPSSQSAAKRAEAMSYSWTTISERVTALYASVLEEKHR